MQIEIWSKDNCNYCAKAKSLLKAHNRTFTEYKLGEKYTKEDLWKKVPNAKTVPQIFIDNEHIGGYTELVEFMNSR